MKIVVLLVAVLLSGCATMSGLRSENRLNIMKLSPGMGKPEVSSIMGTKLYSTMAGKMTNPYRSEMYRAQGSSIEVLMYYTDIKSEAKAITDDDLTPVIFVDGKLDGWGWSYWQSMIQKYEIRIR
jgi:outer membrane protein assembly factor BamE (lipoprotein component of BamABCDE complex)